MPTAIVLIVVLANKLVLNTGCFVVGSLERTLLHDSWRPPSALCQSAWNTGVPRPKVLSVRMESHMVAIHGPCGGVLLQGLAGAALLKRSVLKVQFVLFFS